MVQQYEDWQALVGSKYVVEYSPRQQTFYHQTVARMMERNNRNFERGTKPDYFPVAFAETSQTAAAIAMQYQEMLDARLKPNDQ